MIRRLLAFLAILALSGCVLHRPWRPDPRSVSCLYWIHPPDTGVVRSLYVVHADSAGHCPGARS